jgi:hypothetical protein
VWATDLAGRAKPGSRGLRSLKGDP